MNDLELSVSIVTFKTDPLILNGLLDSILSARLNLKVFVIDNSPINSIEKVCRRNNVTYIFNNKNVGFGSGHNIALKQIINLSKYHLITNTDISFNQNILESLYNFMESDARIGAIMPKILNNNGTIQYLCKLLPMPHNLFLRRFPFVFRPILNKINSTYEFSFADYNKIMDVPCLSGCFMFIRTLVLKEIGLFDERFFMYLEDVDLSRRIHKLYKTKYYPDAIVCHKHEKGSYKSLRLLLIHILSAIKYFNKWGWIMDKERDEINNKMLVLYKNKA